MTPRILIIWQRTLFDHLFESAHAIQNNLEQQAEFIHANLLKSRATDKKLLQDLFQIQKDNLAKTKQLMDNSLQTLEQILFDRTTPITEKSSGIQRNQDPAATEQAVAQDSMSSGHKRSSKKTASDSRYGKTKKGEGSKTTKTSKKEK